MYCCSQSRKNEKSLHNLISIYSVSRYIIIYFTSITKHNHDLHLGSWMLQMLKYQFVLWCQDYLLPCFQFPPSFNGNTLCPQTIIWWGSTWLRLGGKSPCWKAMIDKFISISILNKFEGLLLIMWMRHCPSVDLVFQP